MFTILSCDPGAPNFGFAIVEFSDNTKTKCVEIRVVQIGLLQSVLKNLKDDPRAELKSMHKEINELVKKHSPDIFIAERFLIRSFRTQIAETIPMMIGYLLKALPAKIDCRLTMAVTWKAKAKKVFGLKKLDQLYTEVDSYPHELDAVLMAIYCAGALELLADGSVWGKLKTQINKLTTKPNLRKK